MIDTLIAIYIAFGAWNGMRRGALSTILGVVAFIVALALAFVFYKDVASVLAWGGAGGQIGAFIAILALGVVGGDILIALFKKTLRALKLGLLDGLLGAVVGGLKNFAKVLVVAKALAPIWSLVPMLADSQILRKFIGG